LLTIDASVGLAQADNPIPMGSAGNAGGAIGNASESVIVPTLEPARPQSSGTPVQESGSGRPSTKAATTEADRKPPGATPKALETEISQYHVSEVTVDGEVKGDRAELTVTINVEISRDGTWFNVPLRLGQAQIFQKSSSGPGEQAPASPALQDDGLHWMFRGAGTHRLVFQVGVPISSTPAGEHLQLSLPAMPALFEARMKLRIPEPNVLVRSFNREAALRIENSEDQKATVVEGSIPGGRLELGWQKPDEIPDPDWRASSVLTLRRATAAWELQVQQTVRRSDLSAGSLLVHLPSGFTAVDVSGPEVERFEPAASKPGWIRILLKKNAGDRLELRYLMRAPFPTGGGILDLAGFDIDNVRVHEGQLRVLPVAGYLLLPMEDAIQFLERVEDSPATADRPPSLFTYAFSSPQWRFSLNAKQQEPIFVCEPRYELTVFEDEARFAARFQLREDVGDVRQLRVNVSALEAAGWVGVTRSTAGASVRATRTAGDVVFEFLQEQPREKRAELHFERRIQGKNFGFPLPLPQIYATWTEAPVLSVQAGDAVRVEIDAVNKRELASDSQTAAGAAPRLAATYQLAAGTPEVGVKGTIETRKVSATTIVSIRDVQRSRVTVEQAVRLNVEFGRLSAVRFRLPPELPVVPGAEKQAFRIRIDGIEAAVTEYANAELRVPLTRPVIGGLSVTLTYALPRSSDEAAIDVPVVETLEAVYSDVTLQTSADAGVKVASSPGGWALIPTSTDEPRWVAPGESRLARITISPEARRSSQRGTIPSAFVTTQFDSQGRTRTLARYRLSPNDGTFAFRVPEGAINIQALLGDRPAESALRAVNSGGGRSFELSRRADETDVSVQFDLPAREAPRAIGLRKAELPELESATVENMIWTVQLPETDVLFRSPGGMTSLDGWRRQGIFWQRHPGPRFVEAVKENGILSSDAMRFAESGYSFEQMGYPIEIRFWAIDRSLVLLIGAGFTLIGGFAFWCFPVLRNVLSFLLLGFGVCLAAVWYAEPIQVLFQPAAVGLLMATVATFVDSRRGRRAPRALQPESSLRMAIRTPAPAIREPIRTTMFRPANSDSGVSG
jgi:hypothetical protein